MGKAHEQRPLCVAAVPAPAARGLLGVEGVAAAFALKIVELVAPDALPPGKKGSVRPGGQGDVAKAAQLLRGIGPGL